MIEELTPKKANNIDLLSGSSSTESLNAYKQSGEVTPESTVEHETKIKVVIKP